MIRERTLDRPGIHRLDFRARAELTTALLLGWLALFCAQAAQAEEKESWRDRFELHGHVTLAYAESELDRPRALFIEEAILGIPEDGTFDYRMAALQARFRPGDRHTFVLQLSHRHLGDSIIHPLTDDVELDWLYWDWQWREGGRLRLGRFPTPAGIFNEVRDVGTLLPFFRPSFNFYREGSITSETIDGIGLSQRFFADSDWSLDTDVYYGEFEVLEQTSAGGSGSLNEVEATDGWGGQIWLNTPFSGLRLGLGGLDWEVSEESVLHRGARRWDSWYFSIDANLEQFVFRAEFRDLDIPVDVPPVFRDGEADVDTFYGQAGWRATERLSFWVQHERTDIEQKHPTMLGGSFDYMNRADTGVAVNYALKPMWILKAEAHDVEYDRRLLVPVLTPGGVLFDIPTAREGSEYFIVSMSYSF